MPESASAAHKPTHGGFASEQAGIAPAREPQPPVSADIARTHARDGAEATHRCDMCGTVGIPDPVVGCTRCGWDEMRPLSESADIARGRASSEPQHCPLCRFTMSGLGYCVNCRMSREELGLTTQPSLEAQAEAEALARDELPRRRHDDPADKGRAAAVAMAIYLTALLVSAGWLALFGAAWRFGWLVVS